ncbi:MAG TPA: UvrD-helicase domain-containing protein [Bryobacteraceae bacterium]|nr:UvrD-helicase domain-containing protein [Bryobacteraceae bacterium]
MSPFSYPASRRAQPTTDESARRRIRESIGESLIVEASAGTGKTTALVERIVAVLKAGAAIDRIVAVTFTHKAAGEMKLKLRAALDEARREAPVLEDALQRLEEASIGTIHSFCAQILRERPVEARIDPDFEELTEPGSDRIFRAAFRAWLEKQLGQSSPGLKRAFARMAWRDSWDDTPPIEQLMFAGRKLIEWRDYATPWRRDPFAREREIDGLVEAVRDLAALSARPRRVTDNLFRALMPARFLAETVERAEGAAARDYDGLESLLLKLGRDLARDSRKGSGAYGEGATRDELVARREQLQRAIERFRRGADADLAAVLRDEMADLVDQYRNRKRHAGKLDFVDLLIGVRDLVRNQPAVRAYLQQRFTHIFVDEFQDTDPLQVEILLLLAADDPKESDGLRARPVPGKLFLVGDPKQSIYKFRRADMVLYRQIRDTLVDYGVGLVRLKRSFRSVPAIQRFVNAAFETEMDGNVDAGQADWSPLEQHRAAPEGRPSVVVLPVPRPYKRHIAKEAINLSLPDAVAAFTAWLVNESGWGFQARDIAVLLRRRTQGGKDLTRDYARALEARSIQHLLGASRSFHKREEVETLRAALTAIEWPNDELSVYTTLKGSLFAITDELLLRYRHRAGRLHPFRRPEEPMDTAFAPVREALDVLRELHRERNRKPFAATVNALLKATRAHAGFVLRPGGQQILANVARVAELARSYELAGGISFRGFVEELEARAEKEDTTEAPVLEDDSDGVRLLTVHSAKGLEFPVVILADVTANLAAREPDHHVDGARRLCASRLLRCAPKELADQEHEEHLRERAEGVRVAYVAATRARDLLVVTAIGDEVFDGWLSPLNKAIYPSRANWRQAERPVGGCPKFGDATVVERPLEYARQEEFSVRPGLVQPERGEHKVVWWDPATLQLGVRGEFGTSHEILKQDGGGLAAYRAWEEERARVLEHASRPEHDVFIASQAAEKPPEEIAVEFDSTRASRGTRPTGRRFGTLVHAVMRDAALDAGADAIARLASLHGRIVGASGEEIEAAETAAKEALEHPLLERARSVQRRHREYPVVLHLEGARLLEGVVDLAFVENDAWVVVDFKTDADVLARRGPYERQLRWYAYALAKLSGLPAKAWLLGI